MVELTDSFASHIDVEQTLSRVTALAVDLVDGADYADVMLIGDDGFRSVAPSAPVVTKLDEMQLRLDEGPCWSPRQVTQLSAAMARGRSAVASIRGGRRRRRHQEYVVVSALHSSQWFRRTEPPQPEPIASRSAKPRA
jgi:hypothetical protein